MMVGGIKLHDDLIVPISVKLYQARESHVAQIIHHLPKFLLLEGCRERILNDVLHLNNKRLPFLERLVVENKFIIVEVEIVPELILKAEIPLIFSIEIATLERMDVPDIMVEVHGTRRSPATRVGSNL